MNMKMFTKTNYTYTYTLLLHVKIPLYLFTYGFINKRAHIVVSAFYTLLETECVRILSPTRCWILVAHVLCLLLFFGDKVYFVSCFFWRQSVCVFCLLLFLETKCILSPAFFFFLETTCLGHRHIFLSPTFFGVNVFAYSVSYI